MNNLSNDPLNDSFGFWLSRLERSVRAALNRCLAPLGVSTPEWLILALISRGSETPAGLADELGVDRAAITRILGPLQCKGLIRGAPHPSDGRSTVLELTCEGARLLPKLAAATRATDKSFLNLLSLEESDIALRLIRKIAVRLPQSPPKTKGVDQ